jgi:hypothetical protein
MKTAARWPSRVVLALLLSVAMHAQAQTIFDEGGDYIFGRMEDRLTLNGGECKTSPSSYDCDFISVSTGMKDTSWAYASIRIPTRNGSFTNAYFFIRGIFTAFPFEPCCEGRWRLVGRADADAIRGKIKFGNRTVMFVDLNIGYTRKRAKRVPYIAPGSTVISR